MELAILIINGSPIGVGHIDFDLTEEEKKIILNLNYLKGEKIDRPLLISENSSIFKNEKLKRIEKTMLNYVEEYKNKILQIKDELRLVHSWATINDNTNHSTHGHTNSLISCCFYVESEGENKIVFKVGKSTLQSCHYFDYTIKEYNEFNSQKRSINTIKGSIVIFLSDLEHESINKGKKIMLGSNYFITGKMGSHKKYTYLEI
jgi:hypothetical protein